MKVSTLMEFVANQHDPSAFLYLLVDPLADCAHDDPLHVDALRLTLGDDAITRIPRADLAHTPQVCPALIRLAAPGASPSANLLTLSARFSQQDVYHSKRYICGWLSSHECAEVVSQHLASLCHLPSAQHGTQFYPVFEPVRVELFAAAFDDAQQGPWWPLNHWLLTTSGGARGLLSGNRDLNGAVPVHACAMQQDATLTSTLLVAWRRLLRRRPTFAPERWTGDTPLPPIAAFDAYRQIQQARKLGLHAPDDIVALALHCLNLHPRFHEHDGVRSVIDRALSRPRPLSAAFNQYSDTAWERAVSDLITPRHLR